MAQRARECFFFDKGRPFFFVVRFVALYMNRRKAKSKKEES